MRKGFTMIELIFVIVIIGILAAVAIPKMAISKNDATAATCKHELGQIITEISGAYTASKNFTVWKAEVMNNVTNITTGITASGTKGIVEDGNTTVVHGNTWTYNCDGEAMATIAPAANTAGVYQLTVNLQKTTATAPANIKAIADLQEQYNGLTTKVFTF